MNIENTKELRAHWDERYRSGQTPWDTGITPPEVQEFWKKHTPSLAGNLALDIGCGTGLNTLFLARQGLSAIGFDLSGQALMLACKRLSPSAASGQERPRGSAMFVQADVTRLPVGSLGATYALDIGCLHSLPDDRRPAYAQGVIRALRPGGYYHLYVFDGSKSDGPGARGMDDGEVAALFDGKMEIVSEERGVSSTQVSRPSSWFLLKRTEM